MLTRLRIGNFKRLNNVDIELGKSVVLIGPNNSGKTTALQALALWEIGVKKWIAKRGHARNGSARSIPEIRPGVTINRKDLAAIPIPDVNLLWRDLHVRSITGHGKGQSTKNILIDITVDGITRGIAWSCGLEFDYANAESFYCRPLRLSEEKQPKRMLVPEEAGKVEVAFLPPMSGLADHEFLKQSGEIGVLIGQGQTAQVLRNLCLHLYEQSREIQEGTVQPDVSKPTPWDQLVSHVRKLFGVELLPPLYIGERSEIMMTYREQLAGKNFDLSASGRGLQQTLLLLAYMYSNPGSVLLIDEPDAHLEILRQRQNYQLTTEIAEQHNSQIIAASHSEVVLNEAAGRGKVIAFVGKPHAINDRGIQVLKALTDIGFDQYYQAEQMGWVLYVENTTDLAILKAFAHLLHHNAEKVLESPFVHYVTTNLPQRAREHFFALCEGKPDLVGIAIFDRIEKPLQEHPQLVERMWQRREVENYLCYPQSLRAYAGEVKVDDLLAIEEQATRLTAMNESIKEVSDALATLEKPDPWSADVKASDDFLEPLFKKFSQKLKLPLVLRKSEYYTLVRFMPPNLIDPEVSEKLDAIAAVAAKAKPESDVKTPER